MRPKLRLLISVNGDITSDIVFAGLFENESVEVVGLTEMGSYTRRNESRLAQANALRKRMSGRYWVFLVFLNGFYALRVWLDCALGHFLWPGRLVSLRARAKRAGVPFARVLDYNGAEFQQLIDDLKPDLHVLRIGQILKMEIADAPRLGTWCLHSSLLPSYGGVAAEFHALRSGEARIGSTLFKIANGRVDTGPAVCQLAWVVGPDVPLADVILMNNSLGRVAVDRAVRQLCETGATPQMAFAPLPARSYFSWPTAGEVADYRARGRTLISVVSVIRFAASCIVPVIGVPMLARDRIEFPGESISLPKS